MNASAVRDTHTLWAACALLTIIGLTLSRADHHSAEYDPHHDHGIIVAVRPDGAGTTGHDHAYGRRHAHAPIRDVAGAQDRTGIRGASRRQATVGAPALEHTLVLPPPTASGASSDGAIAAPDRNLPPQSLAVNATLSIPTPAFREDDLVPPIPPPRPMQSDVTPLSDSV